MTRNQKLIIATLAVAVILVYCFGIIVVAQYFATPPTSNELAQEIAPTDAPTVRPTITPTSTSTPAPSATLVIPRSTTPNAPTVRSQPGSGVATATATLVIRVPARATNTPRPIVTRNAVANTIQKAFDQSFTASSYRLTMDMSAKGDFGSIPGLTASNQMISLFSMTGEVNGKDNHFVIKGFLTTVVGGDTNKGLEMISVGGKTYIHGPMPMFGAPEDKWYIANSADTPFKSSLNDPAGMVNQNQNADLNNFRKTGTERLDGRQCDVYSVDKNASLDFLRSVDTGTTSTRDALDSLDSVDAKIWICDDGNFHQMTAAIEGHNKDKPTQAMAMQIKLHITDHNANVKITEPANAVPMQAPSFLFSTPTPVKK